MSTWWVDKFPERGMLFSRRIVGSKNEARL
jgi:hypothetical protein